MKADDAVREAHKGCSQRCYQWGDFQEGRLWHQECRLKFHTAFDRAIEAVRWEGKRREFGPCELCWNIAWTPAPPEDEGKPHTFKDPSTPGQFIRCDYCWLKDEYLKVRRDENEACAKIALSYGWCAKQIRARIFKEET